MLAVVAEPDEKPSAYLACSRAATAFSKLSRLGFEDLEYSYSPTGFPTAVCAYVVDSEIYSRLATILREVERYDLQIRSRRL